MNVKEVFKDASGKEFTCEVIGMFRVPDLDKEYIMYSLVDDDPTNDMGSVLLGELVTEADGSKTVLGIKTDERELALAYYNEVSNQLGGE